MKKGYALLLLIVPFVLQSALQAQDESWFSDVTESVGFDSIPAWRLYVADVNNDDYPDLVIVNGINKRNQLSLWLNVPADPESNDKKERKFVDFTEESGINANPLPNIEGRVADVGALADIDNDGDVDLVTGRFYFLASQFTMPEDEEAVLLNDGSGHFTLLENHGVRGGGDVLERMNATNTAFLDYNLDGNIDLYVGTHSFDHARSFYMYDFLFRGDGTGMFTDVTRQSTISSIEQPLYGSNVCDWNNDGWPDVITAPYCREPGSLWKNNGDGTFTDVAAEVNYIGNRGGDNGQTMCQWEAMPADFDNDGDMDILQVLVHGGYNVLEGRTALAINGGPENNYKLRFELNRIKRDAPSSSHLGDMSGSWVDFDNDGWLDLIINQSQYPQANQPGVERSYFLKQNETNRFDDITEELGLHDQLLAPGASEVLDYDLDGDDDLLIVINTNRNQKNTLRLLENNIGNQNNWIGVKLKAPAQVNRSAIGARIYVTAGGVTQMQELTAGHGHFGGQQPLIRNFGIGTNESIEQIEVRWPSKSVENTIVKNPTINQIVTIEGGISGVEDDDDVKSELKIMPNPARDHIVVTLPEHIQHNGTLTIVDLLGREVKSMSVNQQVTELKVSIKDLESGSYFLRIEEKSTKFTGSFIVQ